MKKKNTTVLEVLKYARKLIKFGWTRHKFAADANGSMCNPRSSEAIAFCAVGALHRSTTNAFLISQASMALCDEAKMQTSYFNDCVAKDQKEVISLFDRVIASYEGRKIA